MAIDITLIDINNLQNETSIVSTIAANNNIIEEALQDALSLNGNTPNSMNAPLDMNSNRILNLPAPVSANDAVRLEDLSILNGGGTVTSIPTGGTTGQVLGKVTAADYDVAWQSEVTQGQALSKVNDTNVTLALAGSPTTALLSATQITAGWTGQLSAPRGGSGVNNTNTLNFGSGGTLGSNAFTSTAYAPLNSPTLVTPVLGVATATSINKVAITAPATSATITIPDGVTLTGPAASGTAMTLGNNETVTGTKTFSSGKLVATAPSITGGTLSALTGLAVRSTGAAFDVTLASNDATLTAGRTVNITTSNGSRNLVLSGDLTLGGALTTSGTSPVTLTSTGSTNVTLPTSGTLISRSGSSSTATRQIFTAVGTATYTAPTGMVNCKVTCKGGGGSGGGSATTPHGGGGGEGAISFKYLTAAAINGQTVTVGGGGTGIALNSPTNGNPGSASSVGSLVVAGGGTGGTQGLNGGAGGAGGAVTTADWGWAGATGQTGADAAGAVGFNAAGGGQGGGPAGSSGAANSGGGGGSGGISGGSGAGAAGIVIVEEFYI